MLPVDEVPGATDMNVETPIVMEPQNSSMIDSQNSLPTIGPTHERHPMQTITS